MKFEKIESSRNLNFSEGVLFEAIEKYIEKTNFPKNLVLKKLDLLEKKLIKDNNELMGMISKGRKAASDIVLKSNTLNDKCNMLLMELKRNFMGV